MHPQISLEIKRKLKQNKTKSLIKNFDVETVQKKVKKNRVE